MFKFYGFIIYSIICVLILLTIDLKKIKSTSKVLHILLILFFSSGVGIYSIFKRTVLSLIKKQPDFSILPMAQGIFLMISVSLIIQFLTVIFTKSLFPRICFPGLILFITTIFIMPIIGWGIIYFVWFVIFSGALSGLIFVSSIFFGLTEMLTNFQKINDKETKNNFFKTIREEINKMLKIGTKTFLALAASTGVSMTILFKDGSKAFQQNSLLANGFGIVFGFGIIRLSFMIWIIRPYLNNFSKVNHLYDEFLNKNNILIYQSTANTGIG